MSSFWSRIVVGLAGIPVVLGAVWLGDWWVFGLAAIAGGIALHEYWLMTRPLRPLAPAGYVGAALALAAAEVGDVGWMIGGAMTAFALAFVLKAVSDTRQAATTSISATVMGTMWIGLGLGFLILVRELPDHGRLAALTVLLAVWTGDTFAYFGGRLLGRHKMAPRTSPGKTRSEEHTSELQSLTNLVCRLLLEKKKKHQYRSFIYNKKKNTKNH